MLYLMTVSIGHMYTSNPRRVDVTIKLERELYLSMEPSISIPKPRLCAPLWLSGAEVGMEMKESYDQQKCRVIHMNQAVSHLVTPF